MARYDEVFTAVAQQVLLTHLLALSGYEKRHNRLGRHHYLECAGRESYTTLRARQILAGRCAIGLDATESGHIRKEREVNMMHGPGTLVDHHEHQGVASSIDGSQ